MAYWMILKSKSKGLGNYFTYTISLITCFVIMHTIQMIVLINFLCGNFDRKVPKVSSEHIASEHIASEYIGILLLASFFILHYALSKLYNRKRLGRWYVEFKGKKFMKYSKLFIYLYFFTNLAIIFLLFIFIPSK